jgi:hypothetical protein
MVTITLPETVTAFVKKANKSYTVRPAELTPAIALGIFEYGLGQKLSDSASQVKFSVPADPMDPKGPKIKLKGKDLAQAHKDALAAIDSCFDNLTSGVWGSTRTARETPEGRAKVIAFNKVVKSTEWKAYLESVGFQSGKSSKAELAKVQAERERRITAFIAANPQVLEIAARQLEDEAALGVEPDETAEAA